MEEFDLGIHDLEPVSMNIGGGGGGKSDLPSVNFGSGIELLMNDKKRSGSNSVNIDLGELDNLENEMNELSSKIGSSNSGNGSSSSGGGFMSGISNLFGLSKDTSSQQQPQSSATEKSESNLGQATKDTYGTTKTWDGFSKYNDIPNSGDKASYNASRMTDREKNKKKRMMIKKLEEWYEKGTIKNISRFNNDSPYEDVEDEYETAVEDKKRKDSVKLQGWWFMTFVNTIEYGNSAIGNPFDLNLDGWGEQVSENIDDYEEIFAELYEKYKGGKMAPELSLLLRLGFSAAVVNITNKALSSATPGFNDVIRQSPELMKKFTEATVSAMGQQSPGFAAANNMVNRPPPPPMNMSFGPPPAPVETKNMQPPHRPTMQFTEGPGNRQDINAARGTMFREQGVDMNNGFSEVNSRPQPQQQQPPMRPEMKGPRTDIDSIISGLKTKTVNIHDTSASQKQLPPQEQTSFAAEDDSMISISSLKDMQNASMPKRSNRRTNRSNKNTISLDI